ncbi:hypothetical protein Tco_0698080 [Tanacetum coccineum]
MDDPDITMEEYIQLEAEKAHIDYFKDFENEFPAIVYKDAPTSEPEISSELMGNDQEVLTDEAFFDLEETYEDGEHEITKIFRIETDIFNFETPLCMTFNEFNYLLKIDTKLERASQITRDTITTHLRMASQDLQTASDCTTQPII